MCRQTMSFECGRAMLLIQMSASLQQWKVSEVQANSPGDYGNATVDTSGTGMH